MMERNDGANNDGEPRTNSNGLAAESDIESPTNPRLTSTPLPESASDRSVESNYGDTNADTEDELKERPQLNTDELLSPISPPSPSAPLIGLQPPLQILPPTRPVDLSRSTSRSKHKSKRSKTLELESKGHPGNGNNPQPEIKSAEVPYRDPDVGSFDKLKPSEFILEATTQKNIIDWANELKEDQVPTWLRRPNAQSDDDLLRAVNGRLPQPSGFFRSVGVFLHWLVTTAFSLILAPFKKSSFSNMRSIKPGEIHFSDNAGVQQIHTTPGYNYVTGLREYWSAEKRGFKTTEAYIKKDNVTIVRVPPNTIGRAKYNNNPIVLLPGRHAFNTPLFEMSDPGAKESNGFFDIGKKHIKHGNISLLNVDINELGIAKDNINPRVLLPGLHINSTVGFRIAGSVNTQMLGTTKSSESKYNVQFNPDEDKYEIKQPQTKSSSQDDNKFSEFGPITIASIDQDKIGCAMEGSNPVLLKPGIYIKNSQTFKLTKIVKANEPIEHGTIHVIPVKSNELALVWDNNQPFILGPGVHKINSPTFKLEDIVDANKKIIIHGTIKRIRLAQGEVCLAWENNKPLLLKEPKIYFKDSPNFYIDLAKAAKGQNTTDIIEEIIKPANEKLIKHGSITLFRVDAGNFGYGWYKGKAVEFKPGVYEIDDPQFIFEKEEPINKPEIQFGDIRHITVNKGEVIPVWENGVLKILDAGRHNYYGNSLKPILKNNVLDFVRAEGEEDVPSVNLKIGKPVPLQNTLESLDKISVNTRDRTPMLVTGQVVYRITDVDMYINNIDGISQDKFFDVLKKVADNLLMKKISVVSTSTISPDKHDKNEIKQQPENKSQDDHVPLFASSAGKPRAEGENFKEDLCKIVEKELRAMSQKEGWGVEFVEVSLSDIGYKNEETAKKLAEATEKTLIADAEYWSQQAINLAAKTKEQGLAEQLLIKSESQANADARKSVIAVETEVETQAKRTQSMVKQAEAKRDAAKAEAEGEKSLAEAKLKLLDPKYLELRRMELLSEIFKNAANMPSPSVVFNGSNSNEAANSMFLGQGPSLLKLVFAQQDALFKPKNVDAVGVEEKQEAGLLESAERVKGAAVPVLAQ